MLAAALLEYARAGDSCWPSNRRLAEDLGCCPQTIRNALAALQAAGWVRVELGAGNPTGRVIWLTWRAEQPTPPNRLHPPLKPAGGPPLKPVGPEARIVVVEGQEESPKFARERLRREIPPAPVPPLVTMSPAPETPPAPPALPSRPEPQFPEPALSSPPPPPLPAPPAPGPAPSPTPALPRRPRAEAVPPVPGTPSARSSAIPTPGPASSPAPALPLTPEQQARLAALPAASRDQVLLWLATGDPILVAEARSKLAPPRPRPEAPKTLPELLGRIREDPSYPALAACELARASAMPRVIPATWPAVPRRGGGRYPPRGWWKRMSRRRGRRPGTAGRSSWSRCVEKNDDVNLFQKGGPSS